MSSLEQLLNKRNSQLKRIKDLCKHVDKSVNHLSEENVDKIMDDLKQFQLKADKVNVDIVKELAHDQVSLESNNELYTDHYCLASAAKTKLEKAKKKFDDWNEARDQLKVKEEEIKDEGSQKIIKKYQVLYKNMNSKLEKIDADINPAEEDDVNDINALELEEINSNLTHYRSKLEGHIEILLDEIGHECLLVHDFERQIDRIEAFKSRICCIKEPPDQKAVMFQTLGRKWEQIEAEVDEFATHLGDDRSIQESRILMKDLDSLLIRNNEIKSQVLEVNINGADRLVDYCCDLHKKVNLMRVGVQKQLDSVDNVVATSGSGSVSSKVKYKALEPPKFNSVQTEWIKFKGLFEDYITDAGLTGKQKLQQLQVCISGDAYNLIKLAELSDDGFDAAWKLLCTRYEDKRKLAATHIDNLLNVSLARNDSAVEIRNVLDTCRESVIQLKLLEADTEKRINLLLSYLVTRKLDFRTQKEYTKTLAVDEFPDVMKLFVFLEQHARTNASTVSVGDGHKFNKGKYNNRDRRDFRVGSVNVSEDSKSGNVEDRKCSICDENHQVWKCSKFLGSTVPERWKLLREARNLCFRCLGKGHRVTDCSSNRKCSVSGCAKPESHDRMLHQDFHNKEEKKSEKKVEVSAVQQVAVVGLNEKEIVAATCLVNVEDSRGQPQLCRIMLDSGAFAPVVSAACINRLGLKASNDTEWTVQGVTGQEEKVKQVKLELNARYKKFTLSVNALVVKKPVVIEKLVSYREGQWPVLEDLKLADPDFYKSHAIDILIGFDFWNDIVLEIPGETNSKQLMEGVKAVRSHFGWIVQGAIKTSKREVVVNTVKVNGVNCVLDNRVKQFFEIEDVPKLPPPLTEEQEKAVNHFKETLKQEDDGRLEVTLPVKGTGVLLLGESYFIAERRLKSSERSKLKNPAVKEELVSSMQEAVTLGHLELVPEEEMDRPGMVCYIPYHPVFKMSSTTTKCRFVYDASCKTSNGKSLNDNLMNGPKLQDDIVPIIMRFRTYVVAVSADIAKMYKQFLVNPAQRDLMRLLYRENPSDKIKVYRSRVLMFGLICAPFLAIKCLQKLAKDNMKECPRAYEVLMRDMFMDDLMSGAMTVEEALKLQEELLIVMKKGCLEMRKWTSNVLALMESVPEELRETKVSCEFGLEDMVKALGLQWYPQPDYFSFTVAELNECVRLTKRMLLSELTKLFDPMGWLAPIIVLAKIMLRSAWLEKTDWDVELPENLQSAWRKFWSELKCVSNIRIPRCMTFAQATYELHGFSDASEDAYSAVFYLRAVSTEGIKVMLVTAKTRVAPVKTLTIPKLELCGAVLLAELLQVVKPSLNLKIDKCVLWTDSSTVLCWLKKEPINWNVFVANRVAKIQSLTDIEQWCHVEGKLNPADCASRGLSPSDLENHQLWWEAASFLHEPTVTYKSKVDDPVDIPEVKIVATCNVYKSDE